jgi:hypothetical protein
MRTRVIPAQITTVEDRIAGNLNLTQILLLMIPVILGTGIFSMLPPTMHIAWYKIALTLIITFVSLALAIRIKGKVILQWLVILLTYNLRPKFYVFNKNDRYLRSMDIVTFEKKTKKLLKKAPAKQEKETPRLSIGDVIKLEGLLANPNISFSVKSGKKGALNVAFKQI